MKYFGKPVEVVQKRKIEYVTCDCCGKKIEKYETYFLLCFVDRKFLPYYDEKTTGEDLCKDCMSKRVSELVKEMYSDCELEISGASYHDNSYAVYNKYTDKLIEGKS